MNQREFSTIINRLRRDNKPIHLIQNEFNDLEEAHYYWEQLRNKIEGRESIYHGRVIKNNEDSTIGIVENYSCYLKLTVEYYLQLNEFFTTTLHQQTDSIDWISLFDSIDIEQPINHQAYITNTFKQKKKFFSEASLSLTIQYLTNFKKETYLLSERRKLDYINSLNVVKPNTTNTQNSLFNQTVFDAQNNYFEFIILYKSLLEKTIPQQTEKQKPELNEALISFSSPEIIENLHKELKGYFQGKEAKLKRALKGEKLNEFLLFPHNQNKFVEVFKRLKYNSYLLSTPKEIETWICLTFTYQYQKGNNREVRNFNTSSVHDILTKDKGEPTKKERICIVDWLPYKNHLTRQRESEKENI